MNDSDTDGSLSVTFEVRLIYQDIIQGFTHSDALSSFKARIAINVTI